MKILLIEDEEHKREAIAHQIRCSIGEPLTLVECESLRGGLRAIVSSDDFDLVLLDMSMPGFDSSEGNPEFEEPESFAGREILAQMKYRGINVPVIVVTQYKAFARGTVGLEELTAICEEEFSGIFQEAIYYSTVVESWKKDLELAIQRAKK